MVLTDCSSSSQQMWLRAQPGSRAVDEGLGALAPLVDTGMVCPSRAPTATPSSVIHGGIFHRSCVPAEGSPCCVWQGTKISWIQKYKEKCCNTQE